MVFHLSARAMDLHSGGPIKEPREKMSWYVNDDVLREECLMRGAMAKEKKHAFVICEIGWEYNDENYYRPESQGVTPKKIYMDAAEALKECRRLNAAGDGSMEDDRGNVLQQYEVVEVEVA